MRNALWQLNDLAGRDVARAVKARERHEYIAAMGRNDSSAPVIVLLSHQCQWFSVGPSGRQLYLAA
jgi:hypothetical protein